MKNHSRGPKRKPKAPIKKLRKKKEELGAVESYSRGLKRKPKVKKKEVAANEKLDVVKTR